jgi:hypothetical protein
MPIFSTNVKSQEVNGTYSSPVFKDRYSILTFRIGSTYFETFEGRDDVFPTGLFDSNLSDLRGSFFQVP